MASTLFIQVPPKALVQEQNEWRDAAFPFCLASSERHLLQHGRQNLQDLAALARSAGQVVLLLASADVAVFSVDLPPMSPQKLKAALPNLLEDRVLEDPASLLFNSSAVIDGSCTVTAVARDWVETLYALARTLEPRKVAAFPLALGLPTVDAQAVVMLELVRGSAAITISVKTGNVEVAGINLEIQGETPQPAELQQALRTVSLFSKGLPISLALDSHLQQAYDAIDDVVKGELNITSQQNADWTTKIASDFPASLNLFAELNEQQSVSFDWLKWRWSIALAASIVLFALFGLNWEAYQMRSEANTLNSSLRITYQQLFPNETSLRDPILQLQQKINQSKKLAGQSTDEDFLVLNGQLALAWQTAHPQQMGAALASLEYRDRSIFFKPKNSGELQLDALRTALQEFGLKIEAKDGLYKVAKSEGSAR